MLDREACIVLNMISGVGYVKYSNLCRFFGSPAEVYGRSAEELSEVSGIGPQLAEKISTFNWQEELQKETELCNRAGVRILTLLDEAYPEVLRNLYDPPLCLYVRGTLPEFPDNAVAVVGSRRMSNYGESMTKHISTGAVKANYTIVSGLALGVDTVAHWTAVDNGGITVAVLGGGLMRLHPQENSILARKIVEKGGAVISEFPMNFPVSRTSFPRRNRIVAGLSSAVIVTEAGLDSGALITARLALENGRDVFAVPGRVDNPQAKGCHQLIREGAVLIETFDDVLSSLNVGLLPLFPSCGELRENAPEYRPHSLSDLSVEEQQLLDCFTSAEDFSIEELSAKSGLPLAALLSILQRLEMKMLLEQDSNQRYRRQTSV
ncbi:MAG: DNA-processing protein DprA [Lentisphaeria bacterium]|nr:DNA-processing protein DprA [Lentisphaeria bacterium]